MYLFEVLYKLVFSTSKVTYLANPQKYRICDKY